jgi:formyltetrahydrofolate synthetase
MPSSLEIAQSAVLRPIDELAAGRFKSKMTHLLLSQDPVLTNAPTGFTVSVRALRAYTGAGWIGALCGDKQMMPGPGVTPAAVNLDIDDEGRTIGLF